MWYTGLPLRHSLPNPIVVCTNNRTCSLSSVIAKLSYMFSHWSRPHVCLAIHAILRGWVSCTQFQQNSLTSGHVFDILVGCQFWALCCTCILWCMSYSPFLLILIVLTKGLILYQKSLLALKLKWRVRCFLSGVFDVVHSEDPPFFPLLKTFHTGSLILKSENPSYGWITSPSHILQFQSQAGRSPPDIDSLSNKCPIAKFSPKTRLSTKPPF